MKTDWIKIRGNIGLVTLIVSVVLAKILITYNLFPNNRLLIGFVFFIVFISSLALYVRYFMEKNKK